MDFRWLKILQQVDHVEKRFRSAYLPEHQGCRWILKTGRPGGHTGVTTDAPSWITNTAKAHLNDDRNVKHAEHQQFIQPKVSQWVYGAYLNKYPAAIYVLVQHPVLYFQNVLAEWKMISFTFSVFAAQCLWMKPCIILLHWPKVSQATFDLWHTTQKKKNILSVRFCSLLLKHSSCVTVGGTIFRLKWRLYASKYIQEGYFIFWKVGE